MDLRLANHCRRIFVSNFRRVSLVDQDRPRGPAIRERQPVQIVEQAGRGRGRKAGDGEDANVLIAKARLQPAGQRLISQQCASR